MSTCQRLEEAFQAAASNSRKTSEHLEERAVRLAHLQLHQPWHRTANRRRSAQLRLSPRCYWPLLDSPKQLLEHLQSAEDRHRVQDRHFVSLPQRRLRHIQIHDE